MYKKLISLLFVCTTVVAMEDLRSDLNWFPEELLDETLEDGSWYKRHSESLRELLPLIVAAPTDSELDTLPRPILGPLDNVPVRSSDEVAESSCSGKRKRDESCLRGRGHRDTCDVRDKVEYTLECDLCTYKYTVKALCGDLGPYMNRIRKHLSSKHGILRSGRELSKLIFLRTHSYGKKSRNRGVNA